LVAGIRTLVDGGVLEGAPAPATKQTAAPEPAPARAALKSGVRELELLVGPLPDPSQANNLIELFKEITDLGTIEMLDGGQAADGMRRFKIVTASSDSDLLDLFTFHVAREQVILQAFGPGFGFHEGAPGAPEPEAPQQDAGYGFFDDAPGAPGSSAKLLPQRLPRRPRRPWYRPPSPPLRRLPSPLRPATRAPCGCRSRRSIS
jgi:two-component system chemotaxis sensor kinase CheA